ncbi:MAG: sialate O-acetylesterase [Flavobacteriaceae bacterium]
MKTLTPFIGCLLFGLALAFGSVWQAHGQEDATGSTDLYLLIGQSNMAGRGTLDSLEQLSNERILMLDSTNSWVLAKDPLHFDKPYAGVGPGIAFAQQMLIDRPDRTIGLIPCAWGGSPIKVWQPGARYFNNFPYDEAVQKAKIALEKGRLKGVLWHQGESDNTPEKADLYLDTINILVQNLRRDLNLPELPFVLGEIGYFNKQDYINPILKNVPETIKHTALVSSEGLTDKGDQLHFDTASARVLGRRYAVAMKTLQQNILNTPTVVLTFDDAEISHYTQVAPLLLEYGFNATFFVCDFPIKNPDEKGEYMQWNQILALHKMGFEIGNHTGHHKNVTKLSPEDVANEVKYIEAQCEAYGIPKPTSFAYPGNRNDSISQHILKEMGYKWARTGGSRLYNKQIDNPMAIPSYTVASTPKLTERITKALQNLQAGDTMVLTFHGVPDRIHPDYSTDLGFFKELLAYIKERHFRVKALNKL